MSILETRGNVYERAWALWGNSAQMVACAEEFCELSAALLRFSNNKTVTAAQVIEEMVDAEIMLEQLQRFFRDYLPEMEKIKQEKIERLARRMDAVGG